MHRLDVLNLITSKIKAKKYLEIGVDKGKVFLQVNVNKKLAVDPVLKIPFKKKLSSCIKDYHNIFNEYFEITSDKFFEIKQNHLEALSGIDLIFVDGLHAYEQAYRDVLNSLKYVSQKGIIIMHDCNPSTESEAKTECPPQNDSTSTEDKSGSLWCGDVWKTIVRLRSEQIDLNIFVLDCDFGIGVISKGKNEVLQNINEKEISSLNYSDLDRNRQLLLNLKPPEYLESFLDTFVRTQF
jgi:hypothetical protein